MTLWRHQLIVNTERTLSVNCTCRHCTTGETITIKPWSLVFVFHGQLDKENKRWTEQSGYGSVSMYLFC